MLMEDNNQSYLLKFKKILVSYIKTVLIFNVFEFGVSFGLVVSDIRAGNFVAMHDNINLLALEFQSERPPHERRLQKLENILKPRPEKKRYDFIDEVDKAAREQNIVIRSNNVYGIDDVSQAVVLASQTSFDFLKALNRDLYSGLDRNSNNFRQLCSSFLKASLSKMTRWAKEYRGIFDQSGGLQGIVDLLAEMITPILSQLFLVPQSIIRIALRFVGYSVIWSYSMKIFRVVIAYAYYYLFGGKKKEVVAKVKYQISEMQSILEASYQWKMFRVISLVGALIRKPTLVWYLTPPLILSFLRDVKQGANQIIQLRINIDAKVELKQDANTNWKQLYQMVNEASLEKLYKGAMFNPLTLLRRTVRLLVTRNWTHPNLYSWRPVISFLLYPIGFPLMLVAGAVLDLAGSIFLWTIMKKILNYGTSQNFFRTLRNRVQLTPEVTYSGNYMYASDGFYANTSIGWWSIWGWIDLLNNVTTARIMPGFVNPNPPPGGGGGSNNSSDGDSGGGDDDSGGDNSDRIIDLDNVGKSWDPSGKFNKMLNQNLNDKNKRKERTRQFDDDYIDIETGKGKTWRIKKKPNFEEQEKEYDRDLVDLFLAEQRDDVNTIKKFVNKFNEIANEDAYLFRYENASFFSLGMRDMVNSGINWVAHELSGRNFGDEEFIMSGRHYVLNCPVKDIIWPLDPKVEEKNKSSIFIKNYMSDDFRRDMSGMSPMNKVPYKIADFQGYWQKFEDYTTDHELAGFIRKNYGIDPYKYHISSPNDKLIAAALSKYSTREDPHVFDINYKGVKFTDWIQEQLDRVIGDFEVPPLDVGKFTEDDLTVQSKKSSPGLMSRSLGVTSKLDKLDESKIRAQVVVDEILKGNNPLHIWSFVAIPKKSKKEIDTVRVAFAPDMFFYIIQYLLWKPFCAAMENSDISSKWELFFGEFDKEVRKIIGAYMESIDMRDFGGRIGPEVFEVYRTFMLKRIVSSSDKIVFNYILDDILKAKVALASNFGGGIWQTLSGWKDGPYGTTYFDAFALFVGICYLFFKRLVQFGAEESLVYRFGPELNWMHHYKCSVHGDNHLASYPRELYKYFYANDPKLWLNLGWELKEITAGRAEDVELMGFAIQQKIINGAPVYIGYRPPEKTARSLVIRRKRFEDPGENKEYLRQIVACLLINDWWQPDSRRLLLDLFSELGRPQQINYDTSMSDLRDIFEKVGSDFTKYSNFWTAETQEGGLHADPFSD